VRGDEVDQGHMFSYVSAEKRVPADHPLRKVRKLVDVALERLSKDFAQLYAETGRPSIPPERLLRALLLQYFYGIRSERMLMEQLDYNLLFRWFVGLQMDDPVWVPTTFTKNRARLLEGDIAQRFLRETVALAQEHGLTSAEHFSVDGTLLEAWASQKSFKPKDGGGSGGSGDGSDFRGEKRRNDTHASTTDPDSRLYRKGHTHESKLSYLGHVVIENRNGLVMDCQATEATGFAERDAAAQLLAKVPRLKNATAGADRAYDSRDFVARLRALGITPHVAQYTKRRRSAIDGRTTRFGGYRASQIARKRVEHPFGWIKSVAGLFQLKHRGLPKVDWVFTFATAAYNLTRLRRLIPASTPA
jgi:transposase